MNLGKPSSRFPPTAMEHNRGVVLTYVEGDMCNSGSGARWNTTLLLLCKRDVHVVCVLEIKGWHMVNICKG